MKRRVRDTTAQLVRALPPVPGKARVGRIVQDALSDYGVEDDAVVWMSMRDGSRMRLDLRSTTQRDAFWTGRYDADILRGLLSFLAPGFTALDVGAHVGFYSVPLGRRLRELGGSLWSFEPVPSNFARLCENVQANGLQSTVRALPLALGDREASVEMQLEAGAPTGNAVTFPSGDASTAGVKMSTLDRTAARNGIDSCHLIKADIEGAELSFLRGAAEFVAKHRPLILAELNAFWMARFGWDFEDLRRHVAPLGYALYSGTKLPFIPLARAPAAAIAHVLLVPTGSPLEARARRFLVDAA